MGMPNHPFRLGHMDPIYYTHAVTDPTHLPNHSSIAACTSAQLRNKVPVGYSGMPQIHLQNYPLSFDGNHPHLIHLSLN